MVRMRDPLTNFEQTAVMTLDALPQRPPKTTKLLIETSFQSETDCHIRVTDMGFGEIFAATGKVWEMHFDIGEASEASGQSAKEAVIEATIPQEVFSAGYEDVRNSYFLTGGIYAGICRRMFI